MFNRIMLITVLLLTGYVCVGVHLLLKVYCAITLLKNDNDVTIKLNIQSIIKIYSWSVTGVVFTFIKEYDLKASSNMWHDSSWWDVLFAAQFSRDNCGNVRRA